MICVLFYFMLEFPRIFTPVIVREIAKSLSMKISVSCLLPTKTLNVAKLSNLLLLRSVRVLYLTGKYSGTTPFLKSKKKSRTIYVCDKCF